MRGKEGRPPPTPSSQPMKRSAQRGTDGTLPDGTGHHARLAETAAPGAAAEEFHGNSVVDNSPPDGTRSISGKKGFVQRFDDAPPNGDRNAFPAAGRKLTHLLADVAFDKRRNVHPLQSRRASQVFLSGRASLAPERSVITSGSSSSPSPTQKKSINGASGSGESAPTPPAATSGSSSAPVRRKQRDTPQVRAW